MTKTINAIFEKGMFKPVEPVAFAEGEAVQITVSTADKSPGTRAYEMIAEIAGLPDEGPDDGFSGADHDKVLYGGKDGAR